jgi:hypothetical protein
VSEQGARLSVNDLPKQPQHHTAANCGFAQAWFGSAPYGVSAKDTLIGVFFHFNGFFGLYMVVKKLAMTRYLGLAVNG